MLYTWRRHAMSGELNGVAARPPPLLGRVRSFAEVPIAEPQQSRPQLIVKPPCQIGIMQIEVELASGFNQTVDAEALAQVLSVVGRRRYNPPPQRQFQLPNPGDPNSLPIFSIVGDGHDESLAGMRRHLAQARRGRNRQTAWRRSGDMDLGAHHPAQE